MKVAKSHMKNYGKDKTIRTFKLKDFDLGNWKEWGDALAFHAQAVMSGDDPDNHSLKLTFPDDDWDDYGYDDEDEDEDIYENELKESKGVKLTQEEYTDLYPVIGRGGLGYQFNYSPKLGGAYISPRDGEDALSIAQEIEGKFEGKLEAEPFQYQDQQFVSGTRAGSIPTGTESTFLRIVKAN